MNPSPTGLQRSLSARDADLPCQHDPERWFDRDNRTAALAACLACPARIWCARQALAHRASWGMWAGIWIDGRLEDAVPHLRAVAESAAAPRASAARDLAVPAPPPPQRRTPGPAVRAAVTARSGGHCEILAPGCRYTAEEIVSRVAGLAVEDADDPSVTYASCRACEALLADLDSSIVYRLGYRVDSADRAAAVPFCWRQARWAQLDITGRLYDSSAAHQDAVRVAAVA